VQLQLIQLASARGIEAVVAAQLKLDPDEQGYPAAREQGANRYDGS
jgi:hypothetical protein